MPKHLGATTPVFPQDLFNHNQLMMVDFSPSPVMFFRWWGFFPSERMGQQQGRSRSYPAPWVHLWAVG